MSIKESTRIDVIGSEIDKGDLQERADNLSKEMDVIFGKYELSVQAVPFLTADGRVVARPVFVSSRKPLEKKSEEKETPVEKDNAGLSE